MHEIELLRKQIEGIAGVGDAEGKGKGKNAGRLAPPSDTQVSCSGERLEAWACASALTLQLKVLRQILTAAFIDQIAIREDVFLKKNATFTSCRGVAYRTPSTAITSASSGAAATAVYIHPSSALFHRPPPEWVVYTELHATGRAWMKGVSRVNPAWLWALAREMCSLSRPVEMPGAAGKAGMRDQVKGDERTVVCVPHLRALGVDLPAVKVRQMREGARWVAVE
jgi:ATP-dependent RNA helicase DHX37/DHR1